MPIGRPVETILGVSSLFPQDETSRTSFKGIPPDVGRTGGIVGMGGIGAISDLAVGPFRTARLHPFTGPGGWSVAWNCDRAGIDGIRDLVDLVGIEPTTSSMPFLTSRRAAMSRRMLKLARHAVSTTVYAFGSEHEWAGANLSDLS